MSNIKKSWNALSKSVVNGEKEENENRSIIGTHVAQIVEQHLITITCINNWIQEELHDGKQTDL